MTAHVHRTYCSADSGKVHEEWGPVPCGQLANGPHPDPERGYLEPLCKRHREEWVASQELEHVGPGQGETEG